MLFLSKAPEKTETYKRKISSLHKARCLCEDRICALDALKESLEQVFRHFRISLLFEPRTDGNLCVPDLNLPVLAD